MHLKKLHIDKAMMITILALAWPTMMEQVMSTAVQYIDTAMVGSLGTQATAAVGSTTTINWLVNSSISALGIGFLSYIAREMGAGHKDVVKETVKQAVLIVLTVGILATIITAGLSGVIPKWMQVDESIAPLASRYFFILYIVMLPRSAMMIFSSILRAAKDSKTPMKIGIIINMINVMLNFILIYPSRELSCFGIEFWMWGADLGVVGAALASSIAFCVGGLLTTVAIWKNPLLSPGRMQYRFNLDILRPCMQVALPNMLQRFATSLGYVAFAAMINALGDVSTAAHTIANTVESAFYIPGYGMQSAAATLAGNAYGEQNEAKLKTLSRMMIPIEISLMVLSGAALLFSAPALVSIFSSDPQVINLGTTVLRMVALSEPFYGYFIIVEGMMMGVGKTKIPFFYNIIGMWGVRIVGTFICTTYLDMGLISAWACMIGHNLLLFALFYYSNQTQKWMQQPV